MTRRELRESIPKVNPQDGISFWDGEGAVCPTAAREGIRPDESAGPGRLCEVGLETGAEMSHSTARGNCRLCFADMQIRALGATTLCHDPSVRVNPHRSNYNSQSTIVTFLYPYIPWIVER